MKLVFFPTFGNVPFVKTDGMCNENRAKFRWFYVNIEHVYKYMFVYVYVNACVHICVLFQKCYVRILGWFLAILYSRHI